MWTLHASECTVERLKKITKQHFTSNYILDSATHKFPTPPNRQSHFILINYTLFTHNFLQHSRRPFLLKSEQCQDAPADVGVVRPTQWNASPYIIRTRKGRERKAEGTASSRSRATEGHRKYNEWRNYCCKNSTSDNIPAHSPLRNASNSDVLSEDVFRM